MTNDKVALPKYGPVTSSCQKVPQNGRASHRQLKQAEWKYSKTDKCAYAYCDGHRILTPEGTLIKIYQLGFAGRDPAVVDFRCVPKGLKLRDGDTDKIIRAKIKRFFGDD